MSRPSIYMRRTPAGLAPSHAIDAEALDAYSFGAEVEVTIRQRRSPPHHRFFFATLGRLVASGAVPFETTDEFLSALKMACGITELRKGVGGVPYIVPGSISFAAKDEPAFKAFREKAFDLIRRHYGVEPETVLEAA